MYKLLAKLLNVLYRSFAATHRQKLALVVADLQALVICLIFNL